MLHLPVQFLTTRGSHNNKKITFNALLTQKLTFYDMTTQKSIIKNS